jgi:hypothetical protein
MYRTLAQKWAIIDSRLSQALSFFLSYLLYKLLWYEVSESDTRPTFVGDLYPKRKRSKATGLSNFAWMQYWVKASWSNWRGSSTVPSQTGMRYCVW